MNDYVIASASTADLQKSFLDEHNIPFISYSYTMDGEIYKDNCEDSTREDVYKKMRDGILLSTSMINVYEYHDFFKGLAETGKDIIYLDMSQKMTHSYVNAREAANRIQEEYPSIRFYMMDTLCISGGLGLLVQSMSEEKEKGKSFDEVVAFGEEKKLKIMHRFTVDDLNYLKRGGRVSNASAMVGSLFSIKPVLYVPDDGTLTVSKKVRGRKAALCEIVNGVKRDMENPDGQEVHILHADCLDDANFVKEEIEKAFPEISKVVISNLGVVIGAHCGPGLLTVFYFGSHRCP